MYSASALDNPILFDDGNLLADETPSPLKTSGHGSWVTTGKNSGDYTFEVLVGNTEPGLWLSFTVSGQVAYNGGALKRSLQAVCW